jgi:hypothetical protein
MNDRRKGKDRRAYNLKQDQAYPCNRRIHPCRRLDSISAEWIPMGAIKQYPVLWQVFSNLRRAL